MKAFSGAIRQYRMYLILVLLFLAFSIIAKNFFSLNSLATILRSASLVTIAGLGAGIVIIAGGVDISIGSVMSLATVLAAKLMVDLEMNPWLSGIIAVGCCTLIGAFNGLLVVKTHMPPMICTLGMMTAIRGISYTITQGRSIYGVPNEFKYLGQGNLWIIPVPVLIMLVLVIIAALILNNTYSGRYIYAIGSNEEAARLSGVNINLIRFFTYVVSGVTAGITGIMMLSRTGSGNAVAYNGFEMDVLIAVIVGGISFLGGTGKITSAVVGALIMGVLKTGLIMSGASEYWQQTIMGFVLIAVVGYDSYRTWKIKNADY
ncbi:MAG: ABC transporter permease [Clostridiales bacterium]|nr:ABC transporter permease [Clostridiales bacterium]